MTRRILTPLKELLSLCTSPGFLIQKRHDKLLDFDNAQYKLDKNKDAAKNRIVSNNISFQNVWIFYSMIFFLILYFHHGH